MKIKIIMFLMIGLMISTVSFAQSRDAGTQGESSSTGISASSGIDSSVGYGSSYHGNAN